MFAANKLFVARGLLARASNYVIKESRASYVRAFWPEPITQQTLTQFLDDINYFDEPSELIDIGPKIDSQKTVDNAGMVSGHMSNDNSIEAGVATDVDQILDLLSPEAEQPAFDTDDAALDRDQLTSLALNSGIYRDLFGEYIPDREHIKFTPEQAEKLYKLVPHYWITDQPFARVERKRPKPDPIHYFKPIVAVSARFVHNLDDSDRGEKYAHTSHHGNIIPACEAGVKPSISIDGRWSNTSASGLVSTSDSQFNNWEPGLVSFENFSENAPNNYHTLMLLNLDSLHSGSTNMHWMLANIRKSKTHNEAVYDEICDYLPVHGIRGFGYSRYVFLVFQHDSTLDTSRLNLKDFSLETRKFDPKTFLEQNRDINMVPVGLSWFQTVWDDSSNEVFHKYMNMRAPIYEHVQTKAEKKDLVSMSYPGKIPFNVFMDHYRDKKETDERVLLERLKTIDPFDYRDQYVKPKVPPTVFEEEEVPSWMRSVLFKKKNRVGYWRGLRPVSATLPLNNNADLDYPLRPVASSRKAPPGFPNLYPARPRLKLLKKLPYSKPANEHTNVYIQEDHDVHLDQVKQMMKQLKSETK